MTVWYAGWDETEKNCAPSWHYLQDYTGMHGQQNMIFFWYTCLLGRAIADHRHQL